MSEPPYGPPYPPQQPTPRPRYHPHGGHPPAPTQQARGGGRPVARRVDPETASQVQAAVAARSELGPEYDDAIAAGLAERVEELVAYRTAELRRRDELAEEERADRRTSTTQRFVLGIISLGAGVPITAVAAVNTDPGLIGVATTWAGIVGVNAVFAWGSRRRSP